MGDIADMMLEGILCETCGEFLDDGAPGHPRRCPACREYERKARTGQDSKPKHAKKTADPTGPR
uniref:Uncharacterized protein n=1 Tax=viral metagenome TaxID=1070528 RepID=A0A6M3K994_9ZZZZ